MERPGKLSRERKRSGDAQHQCKARHSRVQQKLSIGMSVDGVRSCWSHYEQLSRGKARRRESAMVGPGPANRRPAVVWRAPARVGPRVRCADMVRCNAHPTQQATSGAGVEARAARRDRRRKRNGAVEAFFRGARRGAAGVSQYAGHANPLPRLASWETGVSQTLTGLEGLGILERAKGGPGGVPRSLATQRILLCIGRPETAVPPSGKQTGEQGRARVARGWQYKAGPARLL